MNKRETVKDKLEDVVIYLKDSDKYNRNEVIFESMKYAKRILNKPIDEELLNQYSYLLCQHVLETACNVLSHYAEDGRYLFIREELPPEIPIKIGEICDIPYMDATVKMELTRIVGRENKIYVFTNCETGYFMWPLAMEFTEDEMRKMIEGGII